MGNIEKKNFVLTARNKPVVGLTRWWNRSLWWRLRTQILEVYDLQANIVHLAPYQCYHLAAEEFGS